MDILRLSRILQFGDSMLPTGTFAFSATLEAAIQQKVVHDAPSLHEYVRCALEQAAGTDAVGFINAWRAMHMPSMQKGWQNPEQENTAAEEENGDMAVLRLIDHALYCRKFSSEARLMSVRTGKKLAEMALEITENPIFGRWLELIRKGHVYGSYPVVYGMLMAVLEGKEENSWEDDSLPSQSDSLKTPLNQKYQPAVMQSALLSPSMTEDRRETDEDFLDMEASIEINRESSMDSLTESSLCSMLSPQFAHAYTEKEVLCVYFFGTAMCMLSASLRLMRVSHVDIQRILYQLSESFDELADIACTTSLEHMNSFNPMIDIMAAFHANSHIRLFMS